MGFISNTFDIKKLARNLDRKKALPDRNPVAAMRGDTTKFSDLDDYLRENVFMPILKDAVIPIGRLDFERITEDDIDALFEAFMNVNFDLFRFCAQMDDFSAAPAKKRSIL